jgi:hypothetical protein
MSALSVPVTKVRACFDRRSRDRGTVRPAATICVCECDDKKIRCRSSSGPGSAGYLACDTRVSLPRSKQAVSDPSPSLQPFFLTLGQRPRPRRAPPAWRHPRAARQGQWRQGPYVPLEGHGRGHLRRPAGHRPRSRNGGLQVPRWLRLGRHRGTLLTHDTHPRTRLRMRCPSIRRSKRNPGTKYSGTVPGNLARCDRRDRPRVDAFLAIKHTRGGIRHDTKKTSHTVAHATSR